MVCCSWRFSGDCSYLSPKKTGHKKCPHVEDLRKVLFRLLLKFLFFNQKKKKNRVKEGDEKVKKRERVWKRRKAFGNKGFLRRNKSGRYLMSLPLNCEYQRGWRVEVWQISNSLLLQERDHKSGKLPFRFKVSLCART